MVECEIGRGNGRRMIAGIVLGIGRKRRSQMAFAMNLRGYIIHSRLQSFMNWCCVAHHKPCLCG